MSEITRLVEDKLFSVNCEPVWCIAHPSAVAVPSSVTLSLHKGFCEPTSGCISWNVPRAH